MKINEIIDILSLILPFSIQVAIVLTQSKIKIFKNFYRSCVEKQDVYGVESNGINKIICTDSDFSHKIIIDYIAYLGIILFSGKNTLRYGYATGISTGLVHLFCSITLPQLYLGLAIERFSKLLNVKSHYFYILIGILLIIALIVLAGILERVAQGLTKEIKIVPPQYNHTEQ